jgi:hypothetical protein
MNRRTINLRGLKHLSTRTVQTGFDGLQAIEQDAESGWFG